MPRTLSRYSAFINVRDDLEMVGESTRVSFIIEEEVVTADTTLHDWIYRFKIVMPQDFCFYYSLDDYKGERPRVTLRSLLVAGIYKYKKAGYEEDSLYKVLPEHQAHRIDIICPSYRAINTLNAALNRFFDALPAQAICQQHIEELYNTVGAYQQRAAAEMAEPPALPQASGDIMVDAQQQFPDGINETKMQCGEPKQPEHKLAAEPKWRESKQADSKQAESKQAESKQAESKQPDAESDRPRSALWSPRSQNQVGVTPDEATTKPAANAYFSN